MKKNYKLTISYDGSRYYGWEHQKSTAMTIQGKLEAVLTAMLAGGVPEESAPSDGAAKPSAAKSPAGGTAKPSTATSPADHAAAQFASAAVDVIGAGRTDAGVHAKAMTASVQLPLAPPERLTDLAVAPREKPHPGAAAREPPRASPFIAEMRAFVSCMA